MLNQQPDRQDITLIFVEFGSTLQIRKKHTERENELCDDLNYIWKKKKKIKY